MKKHRNPEFSSFSILEALCHMPLARAKLSRLVTLAECSCFNFHFHFNGFWRTRCLQPLSQDVQTNPCEAIGPVPLAGLQFDQFGMTIEIVKSGSRSDHIVSADGH